MCIEKIIETIKNANNYKIVVLGDYCLDKYMYSDPAQDDVSVETGMPAWQIYKKKMAAGVGGTIANNLAALGAQVICVGFVGNDGEGFEVLKELKKIGANTDYMCVSDDLVTSTYLKTMRLQPNGEYKEDVRFDYRNENVASKQLFDQIVSNFEKAIKDADGVIISDQFYERNTGAIGDYVREKVNDIAQNSKIPFLVDSRAFAAEFNNMFVKCNNYELMKYCGAEGSPENLDDVKVGGRKMMERTGKTVFITCNKDGIYIFDNELSNVPAFPVTGEIDVTGAGDASNAGIILGLSAGLSPKEAAMIACTVSSITIKQLGTTGTATPEQAISRVQELNELMK